MTDESKEKPQPYDCLAELRQLMKDKKERNNIFKMFSSGDDDEDDDEYFD